MHQPCEYRHTHACTHTHTHTHTHTFNGPLPGSTRVSRYQKGKTNLDFTGARDSEWQWHQLGDRQVCTSFQTDNHTSTPPLSFFTGRMPFLPPNQQCQSTEHRYSRFQIIGQLPLKLSSVSLRRLSQIASYHSFLLIRSFNYLVI